MEREKIKLMVEKYIKKQRSKELIRRGLYRKEKQVKLLAGEITTKKTPHDVTEEEYEQILKTPHINQNVNNSIMTVIFDALGILTILAGFVFGMHYANKTVYGGEATPSIIVFSGFIIGMFWLGFAKIIKQLNTLINK